MAPSRERPSYLADERTQLAGWLDLQRAVIHWKCEGLSGADAYRPVLPASPHMTMAGLVSHLRWAECRWFEVIFMGRPVAGRPIGAEPSDADMVAAAGKPLSQLLDEYSRQCAVSDEIVRAHSLDDVGRHPDFPSAAASLRWILFHMIEETARHAGHLDAMRELLDGRKGYY
jgi:Protein of unknown function (DUF664)